MALSSELERMRAFVSAVLTGVAPPPDPPIELVKKAHLGPIAYRLGVQELRHEYAASMIVADRRRQLLRESVDALGRAGVACAPIKGIGFVGNIYPDPAERPMHDIDLLIAPNRMPDAFAAMRTLGFERVGILRKLSSYYHAQVLERGDMRVELHRNIIQRGRSSMRIEELWQRATPAADIPGAHRLDPVDDLLICMLHIARHELAVPVINYVDVSRLWSRLDAAQRTTLETRAAGYRVARAIAAVHAMTELLAAGIAGHPAIGIASRVLPSTDDVLHGVRPRRARQLAQKLTLVQGPRELAGLGFAYVAAIADGARFSRDRTPR